MNNSFNIISSRFRCTALTKTDTVSTAISTSIMFRAHYNDTEIDMVFETFLPDMNDEHSRTMEYQDLEQQFPSQVAQSIDAGVVVIIQGTLEIRPIYNNHTQTIGVAGSLFASKIRLA
ncbi:hypothetical protein BGZ96_002122 [Linnemannia gamsii]|uniref:NTF2 domain-containing protein n=1 Tax=Linnemannia gamsii TaxID=64522 RepID=A0ABQ7JLC0_9FUNG|nr:hypothetical protein BGZ96_002122 [Linnemannia gamsii]